VRGRQAGSDEVLVSEWDVEYGAATGSIEPSCSSQHNLLARTYTLISNDNSNNLLVAITNEEIR
jgi:hypothetical protein